MDREDRNRLCAVAADSLLHTPGAGKLVAIWAGVAAAAALLTSLFTLLLETQISDTGGLAGMELRSFLSTAQLALGLFTSIALPFWALGHTAACLEISRTQTARLSTLTEGFRRFGPALRFFLLQTVIYVVLAIVSLNISSILFSFTPFAGQAMNLMLPLMENPTGTGDPMADAALLGSATEAIIPAIGMWGVVFMVLCIPTFYRLRLAQLRLVDAPACGALAALFFSIQHMRHNCIKLFLLDLRFWWCYLGELAVVVLCYGDILLPMLGVSLPMDSQVGAMVFYVVSILAQAGLYILAKNRLAVTYAGFYDRVTGQNAPQKIIEIQE